MEDNTQMSTMLELLQSLAQKVEALEAPQVSITGRSVHINEIAGALAKAQAEMKVAGLDAENPYFKSRYADLASIVRASRSCLTKNNLAVTQQIMVHEDGQLLLHTILMHMSGQWLESRMRIVPTKNDPQTLGSTITYLRRYAYAALVGVTASDEDDDAERAMVPTREEFKKGTSLSMKYDPRDESPETISKDQLEELEYELATYPDIAENILEKLKLAALADLPKSKYRATIERIREIKNARNGVK